MRNQRDAPRVAVVGGGVLGVSTAAELAKRGAQVTLVSDGPLASGASGRSLSWLNSFDIRSGAYHRLRLLGIDRYRTFSSRVDSPSYLKFEGGLTWSAVGQVKKHYDAFEHMRRIGYPAEWLRPEEVRLRTPGVDTSAIPDERAIFNPGEGWVELPPLIDHLAQQTIDRGGAILTGVGQSQVLLESDRVTGVRTGTGETVHVDAAVLATGPAVPATVAELGLTVPDATAVALLVRTPPFGTTLRAVLNTPRVSVRPTASGSLVMDSDWSAEEVVSRDDGTYHVDDSTVQGLLREASSVLEGNPTLTVESYGVGLKPIPGDGHPVLGQLPGITGYHVAFTHSGATLALIAGELLAEEIVSGEPSPLLEPFRANRFQTPV